MAIVPVARTSLVESTNTRVTTITGSVTLVNGSTTGRFVEIRVSFKNFDNTSSTPITVTSLTFDSVGCTEDVTSYEYTSAEKQHTRSSIYRIADADLPSTSGTYTVTLTTASGFQYGVLDVVEYSSNGIASVSTDSDSAYGTSTTLTPATAGDYQSAVFNATTESTTTASLTTGTEQYNNRDGGASVALHTITGYATGGSIAVSFSFE